MTQNVGVRRLGRGQRTWFQTWIHYAHAAFAVDLICYFGFFCFSEDCHILTGLIVKWTAFLEPPLPFTHPRYSIRGKLSFGIRPKDTLTCWRQELGIKAATTHCKATQLMPHLQHSCELMICSMLSYTPQRSQCKNKRQRSPSPHPVITMQTDLATWRLCYNMSTKATYFFGRNVIWCQLQMEETWLFELI